MDRLTRKYLHCRDMEQRAHTRLLRAVAALDGWYKRRKATEQQLGEAEVRRIVNRLTTK